MSWKRARAVLEGVWQRGVLAFSARGPASAPRPSRVELIATACLVALGLFFRARGVLFGERLELWNDEASWAMRMFERPLWEHLIRPPAFVVLTRISAKLFGYREFGFRLLPWLAGMATPFVALWLSPRFLRNPSARIFFVGTICLSLNAIDFSKEFKQYALGLLLQLLLPLLALRWVESRQRRDLVATCCVAALGLLFSQDVMFFYPGLFLALLLEAWSKKDRKQMALIVGAGMATIALVASMYLLIWRRIPKEEAQQHWGTRYNVFYLEGKKAKGKPQGSKAAWFLGKYRDMAAMPGGRRDFWSEEGALSGDKLELAGDVDQWLWFGLHVAGLAALLHARRFTHLLLFWSPLLVCTLLNLAGRWPIGAFRTNLFLVAGMSAVAACAFEWFKPGYARLRSLLPTLVVLGVPILLFERTFHREKPGAYAAGVLNLLGELERERGAGDGQKAPLYMDTQACQPFKYYTRYHPAGRRLWSRLESKIEPICGNNSATLIKAAAKLPRDQRAWLLLVNRAPIPRSLTVLSRTRKNKHQLIALRKG